MHYRSIILTLASSFLLSTNMMAGGMLFSGGKSAYTIVVDANAPASEKTAATQLQTYLKQVSGANLRISHLLNNPGKCIFVGFNDRVRKLTGRTQPQDGDEGFSWITTSDGHLVIYGGSRRGTLYGVFSFLERQLGIHWYASDCTKVPKMSQYELPDLNHSEQPAFKYRELFYYQNLRDKQWAVHNLQNCSQAHSDDWGGAEYYWGAHSMSEFVSAKDYFKTHPEYFSQRNGKRVNNGQLCLSNPQVIRILTDKLLQKIKENPNFWCYDLSQYDNNLFCECRNCSALEKRYGGHSGLMIWAVNTVAEQVEKAFPGKCVGTFAYQYTRKPPVSIKPRRNVVIRLSDIECCLGHPIDAAENASFRDDLRAWGRITDNIYIWDYVVGFYQYLAPFPNFKVLATNLRTFKRNHVIGVLEEGQYQTRGSEFAELRQWVLAKLMWDPSQDTDSLVRIFIKDYYGAAAPSIQSYFDLAQSQVKADTHFRFDIRHTDPIYSSRFINKSKKLLKKALKAARNDEALTKRVELVQAQVLFLQYMRNKPAAMGNGTYNDLMRIVKREKMNIDENQTADQFLKKEKYI